MDIICTLMGRMAGGPDAPAALVRRAIDFYLDHRQLMLHNACYPPNTTSPIVPEGLVPLELLAWPPPQRPPAPPGISLFGSIFTELFNYMAEKTDEHIGASATLEPLAREGHTMRVIQDIRYQLNGIVDIVCAAVMDPSYLIPAARSAIHYPPPVPRITLQDELAFSQHGAALALVPIDARGVPAFLFSLDAAVTILSSCKSLLDVQSVIFALPHWARACVFVTEMRLQTSWSARQAQAGVLFDRLPNLHRLSLDAGLANDTQPRLPAARVDHAVLDLADRSHWTEVMTRRTLAALGDERVRDIVFDNVGDRPWLAPRYCANANDRPTVVHFLWSGKGFNAAVFLSSLRMRRLHELSARDDAVVFSPLAKSTMRHLVVSNVIRESALHAIACTPSPELEVLEVVLHPGDREVADHLRVLDYRGKRWKRCPHLETLRLCVRDTGAEYKTPIGPVQVSAAEVRNFMRAIASRTLTLELHDVYVPGWNP